MTFRGIVALLRQGPSISAIKTNPQTSELSEPDLFEDVNEAIGCETIVPW